MHRGILDFLSRKRAMTSLSVRLRTRSNETCNERFVRSIENLPNQERTSFIMRFIQNVPTKDIAAVLGMGDLEVSALLTKALGAVRVNMSDHIGIGTPQEIARFREILRKCRMSRAYADVLAPRHSQDGDTPAPE